MKPLTPAQQRVVDVMKGGVMLRMRRDYGWFEFVDKAGYVPTTTANSLIKKGIVIINGGSSICFYYTLSPEYK